ncbi:MAG TPA: DUF1330 domain-containing protein [Dehalococcoidia bacterium]|nr:DUF1330 domain-containing protein [Dehalococcoidia bacterium]
MSAIRPNAEQFGQFAAVAAEKGGPVVMLNLLKFKPDGGARSHGEYGAAARGLVAKQGGRVLYMGRCDQVLIGDAAREDWDAIAVVEYPSRQAFIDMVSRPDYQQAHEHREAGLERTVLIATTPAAAPPKE